MHNRCKRSASLVFTAFKTYSVIFIFNRLCLLILPFVVVSFLSQTFPILGVDVTESMSRQKRPTTITPARFCFDKPPGYICRALEAECLKQIETVFFVQMSSPVIFADLTSYPFSQWPPTQKRQALTSFHIT